MHNVWGKHRSGVRDFVGEVLSFHLCLGARGQTRVARLARQVPLSVGLSCQHSILTFWQNVPISLAMGEATAEQESQSVLVMLNGDTGRHLIFNIHRHPHGTHFNISMAHSGTNLCVYNQENNSFCFLGFIFFHHWDHITCIWDKVFLFSTEIQPYQYLSFCEVVVPISYSLCFFQQLSN